MLLGMVFGCPARKASKPMPRLFYVSGVMDSGKEPSFIVTEDFNEDGNLDLIAVNTGDDTFSFFKGVGDGTFQEQIPFKTGHNPICVTYGRFNGDKHLDLAVLNYADQTIYIYLNTGNGSFKNTGKFLRPGKIPINVIAHDLNRDGFTDLAITMRYHKVMIQWGKGNGYFSDPTPISLGGQPTGITYSDYNGDQRPDIAVALAGSGNVGVQIIWGKDNNRFETSKVFRGGGQPIALANLDADGDGAMDLVTASNSTHDLAVFMNQKDGTFKSLRHFASGEFPKFIMSADFNDDGIPDLAVSNATLDTISVPLGRGDGTFTYPPIYHHVDEYPQGIALGDFNKDGRTDMAITCRDKMLINILLKKNMVNPSVALTKSDKA